MKRAGKAFMGRGRGGLPSIALVLLLALSGVAGIDPRYVVAQTAGMSSQQDAAHTAPAGAGAVSRPAGRGAVQVPGLSDVVPRSMHTAPMAAHPSAGPATGSGQTGQPATRPAASAGWARPAALAGAAPLVVGTGRTNVGAAAKCPASGTWPGPRGAAYLNEYYTGGDPDSQGNCNYIINNHEFTSSYTVGNGTTVIEDQILVDAGATFTVPAGAKILMTGVGHNPRPAILVSGTLNMQGTSSSGITMTTGSGQPMPGQWGGIAFWDGGAGTLSYVHMSYAGSGMYFNADLQCCVTTGLLINHANPTISHVIIDHSAGVGMELQNGAAPMLIDNASNENAGWAVQYDFIPTMSGINAPSVITASGNGHDGIHFTKDGTVSGNLTFVTPGLLLALFDDPIVVGTGAQLALPAGMQATFNGACGSSGVTVNTGAQMSVGAGSILHMGGCNQTGALLNSGTLTMSGTSASPIIMDASNGSSTPGSWGGVAFWPNSGGSLSYVHMSYGGSGLMATSATSCCSAATLLINSANPAISHVTIDHSAGPGMELQGGATPTLTGNASNNNQDWAVQYDFIPTMSGINAPGVITASGNAHDGIHFTKGGTITGGLTFVAPGVLLAQFDQPITVGSGAQFVLPAGMQATLSGSCGGSDGATVLGGASMSVGAGSTISFAGCNNNGAIMVDGALTMAGTANSPITLINSDGVATPGQWNGVAFLPNSSGTLSYVHLSYAGTTFSDGTNAGLLINGANPTISHVTIDHTKGNGMELKGGANPALSGNASNTNQGWAVQYDFIPNATGINAPGVITASGNTHDGIHFAGGGTVTSGLTFVNPGLLLAQFDVEFTVGTGAQFTLPTNMQATFANDCRGGGLTVNAGATMSVGAGSTLGFGGCGTNDAVLVSGTLTMAGTAASPITLHASNGSATPGQWAGVAFWPNSSGTLNYVHLSGGGGSMNDSASHCCASAELLINDASPTISNSTIDQSSTSDVQVEGGGQPILRNNSFLAVPSTAFGVLNSGWASGQPVVDATCSYWAASNGPSGQGAGSGAAVSTGVTFTPFLSSPTAACGATPPDTIQVAQGWNLVSLPGQTAGTVDAQTLLPALLKATGGTLGALYELSGGRWTPSLIDNNGTMLGTNFTLALGQGYLLYSDSAGAYSFAAPGSAATSAARRAAVIPLTPLTWSSVASKFPPLPAFQPQ